LSSVVIAVFLDILIMLAGTVSAVPVVTQTDSTATVYLEPPIINCTEIGVGQNITVNLNIVDAVNIYSWQAGLIFNASVVECLDFTEGEFLSDNGLKSTWDPMDLIINNTLGVIEPYGWTILGNYPPTSGSGTLAYLTFRVKAPGVSDLHLQDLKASDWVETDGDWELVNIPFKIIDVYTVVVDTTPHTVVTVSNSTGVDTVWVGVEKVKVHSGFYDHAFSASLEEISFKVTGPYPGWSNVTVPKALLEVEDLDEWRVIIDGSPLMTEGRTVTYNGSHYSIYFTYTTGIHDIHITTRSLLNSTITINLSSTSIDLGSNVTISGYVVAADTTVRGNVTVTILYRLGGGTWDTLTTRTTDLNGNYTYTWTSDAAGTYELKASWAGDPDTAGDESDVKTLEVKGAAGIDPYIIAAAAAVIIIIAAIVVYYFVKIRKPEEEE